jgi:hypothetical protein
MKACFKIPVPCGISALLLAWLTATLQAQTYSIDWYKVSGGGGTSTGGVYSVSGTIGQHDADGPMTGGSYSLTGGFWALYAVQTPDAPLLSISRTITNTIVVSWPAPAEGWMLERTNALSGSTAPWPVIPQPYQTNAGTISVTFPNNQPTGNQFFRLHKP